jgi:CubicO group peptidase (beta-lactamase class C family)
MRILLLLFSAALLSAQAFDVQGLAEVRAALDGAMAQKNIPGAVYWLEHGPEVRHWAQGQRSLEPNREPMTEDTLFDVASLTKVVATLPSVLLLLERGQLRLEAPVQAYLPEFRQPGITVRHLLTHTSGLPASLPADSAHPDWRGYEEGIQRACACQPNPPPGRLFRYSDVNFILLGEIVHHLSGRPLNVFAEQEVFTPLGMTATRFLPDLQHLERIAPTERNERGQPLRGVVHDPTSRRMGGVAGHAGLFSTAADLARYARFMLRGGPLLKPETLALMRTVQTPPTVRDRRGLGWDLDSAFSRVRGSLFGLGSFGHTGFTGTALWLDPATDSFFILLTNRLHPDGKGQTKELYPVIGTLSAKAIGLKVRRDTILMPRSE